jgi:hypothetical protein
LLSRSISLLSSSSTAWVSAPLAAATFHHHPQLLLPQCM